MDDDGKFILKWKPVHKKTMLNYVILGSVINLLIISLITGIIVWLFPRTQTEIDYLIITIALLFLMFLIRRTLNWFSREKRYKKITNKE